MWVIIQNTVEKILKCLTEENKDVRKGTWTNKEVSTGVWLIHLNSVPLAPSIPLLLNYHGRLVLRATHLVFSPLPLFSSSFLPTSLNPLCLMRKGERPDLTQLFDVGSRPIKNEIILSSDSISSLDHERLRIALTAIVSCLVPTSSLHLPRARPKPSQSVFKNSLSLVLRPYDLVHTLYRALHLCRHRHRSKSSTG